MSGTDVYYMSCIYFKASFIANDISKDLSQIAVGTESHLLFLGNRHE